MSIQEDKIVAVNGLTACDFCGKDWAKYMNSKQTKYYCEECVPK